MLQATEPVSHYDEYEVGQFIKEDEVEYRQYLSHLNATHIIEKNIDLSDHCTEDNDKTYFELGPLSGLTTCHTTATHPDVSIPTPTASLDPVPCHLQLLTLNSLAILPNQRSLAILPNQRSLAILPNQRSKSNSQERD